MRWMINRNLLVCCKILDVVEILKNNLVLNDMRVCLFLPAATTQHIIWWWDSSSTKWLLHTGGEGAPQRGMEALWGTEEKLWEGEKELHRSCYSPGARGARVFWCRTTFLFKYVVSVVIALHSFDCFFFCVFYRKRPFRRTVLLGSRISFWTWLPSQIGGDVPRLMVRVPYQSVSLCN